MKYKIFAGYYEHFVTDKDLKEPLVLVAEFDTIAEVDEYMFECDDTVHIDRDLFDEFCVSFGWDESREDEFVFDAKDYL